MIKNIVNTKPVSKPREYFKRPAFRLGYLDAYYNKPFSRTYDRMVFSDQLDYEQGRLIAKALLIVGLAPQWRPQVQCPRDLPKLAKEYARGAIPRSRDEKKE